MREFDSSNVSSIHFTCCEINLIFIADNYQNYVGTTLMFAKVMSLVMFFRQNPVYGVFYGLLCLCELATSFQNLWENIFMKGGMRKFDHGTCFFGYIHHQWISGACPGFTAGGLEGKT